jgi:hypothetical protein
MKKSIPAIAFAGLLLTACSQQPAAETSPATPATPAAVEATPAPAIERPVLFADYEPGFDFRILNQKTSKSADGRDVNVVFAETSQPVEKVEADLNAYFQKQGFREGVRREESGIVKKDYLSPAKVRYSVSLVPKGHDPRMSADSTGGLVVSWASAIAAQ